VYCKNRKTFVKDECIEHKKTVYFLDSFFVLLLLKG